MTATEIKKPNDLLGKDENFNEELFITNDEFIKDDIHKYLDKTPRDEEAMWINVRIDDGQTLFRCCTGTSTTFITEEFADILKLKIEFGKLTFIFTPTGTITTKWFTKVKLEIGDQIFEHSLPVIRYRKFPHQVLGWDLITKLNCLFDFQNSKILRRENDEYKEIGKITVQNRGFVRSRIAKRRS
ncbi:hypothetical protein SNEBB_007983 [Seison nebaliae]|nr:hypothetical protein SNEBB_007983 [Seison nebaliae]